ncbi:hypothetical protein [Neobacillus sp. FSL H8-0543]|uniref:hypothetical protein n=1 Tax=Neobacillus sp. FSL H8-0543 TaxID=2954672 RepID=UPI0031594C2E
MKKILPLFIIAFLQITSNLTHAEELPVYQQNTNKVPSFTVQHQIKGNDIFVECILTGISFRASDKTRKKVGKLIISIDGKKSQEVASAAFIMKGLSPGEHKVKLEVVNLNNESYGLIKEFLVNIPR